VSQQEIIDNLMREFRGTWRFVTNAPRRVKYKPSAVSSKTISQKLMKSGNKVVYRQPYDKSGKPLDFKKIVGIYASEDAV